MGRSMTLPKASHSIGRSLESGRRKNPRSFDRSTQEKLELDSWEPKITLMAFGGNWQCEGF